MSYCISEVTGKEKLIVSQVSNKVNKLVDSQVYSKVSFLFK